MGTGMGKSLPKYLQLKETLLRYLNDERYEADQKLPTEHALIEQFHVSRGTIRQALAELENEGVLYRIQGSGTFFSGKTPDALVSTDLLGVITPFINDYIFPEIIHGITDIAQQKGFNVVLGVSQANPGKELGCIEQLLAKGIEGLIFDPAFDFKFTPDAALFGFLKTLTIPVVFMGVVIDDHEVSYVSLDDVGAGFTATSYLVKAGHRRIACIYPTSPLSGIHRYQGYRKALKAHGIVYDSRLDKAIEEDRRIKNNVPTQISLLLQELFDLGDERPTAMMFYNDGMAVHGYGCIEAAGFRIPDDISLISFDDSERALQPVVKLTSIIHPKYYLGKWAGEIVLDQIANPIPHFPRHLLIAPTIAERDSVRTIAF